MGWWSSSGGEASIQKRASEKRDEEMQALVTTAQKGKMAQEKKLMVSIFAYTCMPLNFIGREIPVHGSYTTTEHTQKRVYAAL